MAHPVYVLTVNGTVVPSLRIGFDIREVANGRNRMTLAIYSKTGAPLIALFDELQLTEDGVVIFGGYVDAPTEAGAGGQPITPTVTTVSAADFNQFAERRICYLDFAAGTLLSQLQLLATVFAASGVTLDPAQPAGPMMPAWSAHYWRIDDVLNQLTTLSGGYLWNINYSKVLSMRPAASTLAPVQITDANRVAIGDLTVTPTAENFANRVHLLYGDGAHDLTQHWTGDGTTAVFNLTNHLLSHVGYVTNGAANEPIGVTAPPYWIVDTGVVPMTLTRSSPPAPGAAIAFTYTALFPGRVMADAPGGITTPPGFWEVVLTAPDIWDAAVAQAMANDEVAIRSARPRMIAYRTLEKGIHPGQSQTITKTPRHLAAVPCTISEVTIRNATGGPTERIVTAVEGGRFPGTWRDMIKGWNDAGSIAPVTGGAGGGGGGGGGGGSIGPGTPGVIAKFIGTGTNVGNSNISEDGATVTIDASVVSTIGFIGDGSGLNSLPADQLTTGTVPVARLPQFIGGDVVTATAGSVNLQIAAGAITNGDISPSAGIAWTKIDKTGALLSDFGGNITYPQLPIGAGTWTGTPTISGALTLGNNLYSTQPYHSDIGAPIMKFAAIYAAELWINTIVAQQTIATIGGRILVGPTTVFKRDCAPGDTTIYVKHNAFLLHVIGVELGSKLLIEIAGKFEIMTVTNDVPPIYQPGDGSYAYVVARAQAGTANQWYAGDAIFDTGKTGSGFIDLYSQHAVDSPNVKGPSIAGMVRYSGAANGWVPRWAIGNLRGLYGYTNTDVMGFGAGDAAGTHIVIDAQNGIRIRNGVDDMLTADLAGNLNLKGDLIMGTGGVIRGGAAVAYTSGIGYWLAYNGGTPQFRVGDPAGNHMAWDGANVTIKSSTVTINATGITIAQPPTSFTEQYGYKFATNYAGTNWYGVFGSSDASWRRLTLWNSTSSQNPVSVQMQAAAGVYAAGFEAYAGGGANTYVQVQGSYVILPTRVSIGTYIATNGHALDVRHTYPNDYICMFINQTMGGHGTYTQGGDGSGSYNSALWLSGPGAVVGVAASDGNWSKPVSSTWLIYSDARIKRNVTPVTGALARLRQVRIVEYVCNGRLGTRDGVPGVGVIAQDVAPIFPRAVVTTRVPRGGRVRPGVPWTTATTEPILSLNAHELFMATIAAVIELDADVAQLRADLARVKGGSDGE